MRKKDAGLRLVIPTGRMFDVVRELLADAGIAIRANGKDYRPAVSDERFEVKLLKAANIAKLVEFGAHDVGFCGVDWIRESSADIDIVLDTGLLPVRVVVAGTAGCDPFNASLGRPLIAASEYESLTCRYLASRGVEYRFVRTYGATEVFPPEDADVIVDNVATGRTLSANGLEVIDEILTSSTVLVANRAAMADSGKRAVIEELSMLLKSVLDARSRVLLDMNVAADRLAAVVAMLPAMRSPTVQPLHADGGFAVRAAVPRDAVGRLLPGLRRAGAMDILQSEIQRVLV